MNQILNFVERFFFSLSFSRPLARSFTPSHVFFRICVSPGALFFPLSVNGCSPLYLPFQLLVRWNFYENSCCILFSRILRLIFPFIYNTTNTGVLALVFGYQILFHISVWYLLLLLCLVFALPQSDRCQTLVHSRCGWCKWIVGNTAKVYKAVRLVYRRDTHTMKIFCTRVKWKFARC